MTGKNRYRVDGWGRVMIRSRLVLIFDVSPVSNRVQILPAEDGSGVGAALIAALTIKRVKEGNVVGVRYVTFHASHLVISTAGVLTLNRNPEAMAKSSVADADK